MPDADDVEVLDLSQIDPTPEYGDHPEEVTDSEAEAGLALYQAIDDLDDTSTGFPTDDEPASSGPHLQFDATAPAGRVAAGVGQPVALERARRIRRVMLRHGVPEVSIQLHQGRPASGDEWNSLDAVSVFSHHIASRPTPTNPTPGLWLVTAGRSDLPGPLANGHAGVDLVYRIVTLGLANHPGYGGPLTVTGPLGGFTIPKDLARGAAWGTEYEGGYTDEVWNSTYTNRRTGRSMTFREFMGRCNSALVEAIWLEGLSSRGRYDRIRPGMDLSGYHGEHKTWAPGRKPDRRNYSTHSGRAEIRRYTNINEKPIPEEDPMPDPSDLWTHQIPVFDGRGGDSGTKQAQVVLGQSHNRSLDARKGAWAAQRNTAILIRMVRDLAEVVGGDKAAQILVEVDNLEATLEPFEGQDEFLANEDAAARDTGQV